MTITQLPVPLIGGNALDLGPVNMANLVGSDSDPQQINNNADWHMQASASVNPATGDVTGYCHSWTTNSGQPWGQGFHGTVLVTFKDANNVLVGALPAQRYGVSGGWDFTGPHDRYDQFPGHVDLAALGTVTHVGFAFTYDPQASFVGQLEAEIAQTLKKDVTSLVNLVEGAMGGIFQWVAGIF